MEQEMVDFFNGEKLICCLPKANGEVILNLQIKDLMIGDSF